MGGALRPDASSSDRATTEFDAHFFQTGLVLKTGTALRLWFNYVQPPSPAPAPGGAPPERRGGKGRMEEAPTSGPAASMALGKYLLDNAALQTALSMYQHAQERAMRTALRASLPAAAAQQLVAYYRAMMESLVQKVTTKRLILSLSYFFVCLLTRTLAPGRH